MGPRDLSEIGRVFLLKYESYRAQTITYKKGEHFSPPFFATWQC